jgi:hypothetical protein
MVSAFTPESVQAFGPLVMMAVMYQAVGLLLAWLIRELVPVPRDFRWGILVVSWECTAALTADGHHLQLGWVKETQIELTRQVIFPRQLSRPSRIGRHSTLPLMRIWVWPTLRRY